MSTIYRKGKAPNFTYSSKKGKITNKGVLEKIKKYRIPPAWKNVEITLDKDLVAIGIDDAGRKQYVYSEKHTEKKRVKKYCGLIGFIHAIPKIRKDIENKLKKTAMSKDKLIAILLNIIIICSFRIGTEGNREKYNSQGISTITKKEVKVGNKNVVIDFIGKKQVRNTCKIVDPKIVRLLKDIYKKRGTKDTIFNMGGNKVTITDVNVYLKSFNDNVTSKVFRTWLANTKFIDKIIFRIKISGSDASTENKRLKIVREVKKEVAAEMHHTVAVCAKSYLIGELIQLFILTPDKFKKTIINNYTSKNGNTKSEISLLHYLRIFCR
jgi:DNA topoisomerase-1